MRPGGSTIEPGGFKIEVWGLQNRAPRPLKSSPRSPKSSPEAFNTPFLVMLKLRSFRKGGSNSDLFAIRANSMCCARTAALQGGYEKQQVNASRDFWQQSKHHVRKSFESYTKIMLCSCVRHVPKSIKQRKNCGFVA